MAIIDSFWNTAGIFLALLCLLDVHASPVGIVEGIKVNLILLLFAQNPGT